MSKETEQLKIARHFSAKHFSEALQDAIVGGTGVMLDGKRIDPASIYAEQSAQQEFASPGGGYVPAIPAPQPPAQRKEQA